MSKRDCALCLEELAEKESSVFCLYCKTCFHQSCWQGGKACPTPECGSIIATKEKGAAPPELGHKHSETDRTFSLTVAHSLPFLLRDLSFDSEEGWVSCKHRLAFSQNHLWTTARWLPDHAIKYIYITAKDFTVYGRGHRALFHSEEIYLAQKIALFAGCTILSDTHQ